MEKYLIHSNELHLIDAEKIHQIKKKFSNHTRQFVHIKRESLTEVKLSRFSIYLIVISFPDAR